MTMQLLDLAVVALSRLEGPIHLPHGLPGFTAVGTMMLSRVDDDAIFLQLSADHPHKVNFLAVNPFVFFPTYDLEVSDGDQAIVEADVDGALAVYCLVTTDRRTDPPVATVNLLAPLVINIERRLAAQLILDGPYPIRAALLDTPFSGPPTAAGSPRS